MTHKLIHTPNYLLVVDDSEIKERDYCLMFDDFGNLFLGGLPSQYLGEKSGHHLNNGLKKVIAHLQLNDSPILEGVDLLPPLEGEVKWLAYEWFKTEMFGSSHKADHDSFVKGYNKAKEKYKYTEEDIRKAWNASFIDAMSIDEETYKPLFLEDFIQSLSQPKMPLAFECEEKVSSDTMYVDHVICETKTITTTKGHTQWVGKYIY